MTHVPPTRPPRTARSPLNRARPRAVALCLLVLAAAVLMPMAQQVLGSTTATIRTPLDAFLGDDRGQLGVEGGELPEGVTAFDDHYPAVANLDPDLLHALRDATRHGSDAGVRLHVNSGWRSAAYQDQLLDEAVHRYGSREEAARWVATSSTSAHVSGDAVDIGRADAAAWLDANGVAYGLCRTYANEPWHFELRPEARGTECPQPYADPTQDPRLRH